MGSKERRDLPAVRGGLDINRVSRGVISKLPSNYLAEYGFTERLPVLLADLNKALSSLNPDPSRIRMVLNPNLETPQAIWQPAFAPVPQVGIEFSLGNKKNQGELTIGKPIIHDLEFFDTSGGQRYVPHYVEKDIQLQLERKNTVIGYHEQADFIVPVDLKGLKDFVRKAFPKKRAILFGTITDEEREKMKKEAKFFKPPVTHQIKEDLGRLSTDVLNELPLGGYSIIITPQGFTLSDEDKKYKRVDELGLHFSGTFLYLTLEELHSDPTKRYFEIRRLQYKGIAKSMERVMELFNQLFAKDPTGQSQWQADVIRRRYEKS